MVATLTSPANPTLKGLRALHEKKYRRADGRFLAEGLRIVAEAVESGVVPEIIVFAEGHAAHPLVARLVAATEGGGGQAIATTPDLLHRLTLKDNPQAVVGVFRARPTPLAALDRTSARLWLVVQALKDPGNLGTILRTGDAVGAGRGDPARRLLRRLRHRGGPRVDGGDLHAERDADRRARLLRVAARRAGLPSPGRRSTGRSTIAASPIPRRPSC